ncbi:MAG: FAD:protein FMN transferase [Rhodospirillales bacterium]|nr:FAD:protein FMN transferase [Rhodospirillales bacterium]
MPMRLSRRRVITIMAAAAGLPLLFRAGSAQAKLVRWEGTALGAKASIALYHDDEAAANKAIGAGVEELARLERIFSMYRADSAIMSLNRDGALDGAPAELVALIDEARRYAEVTGGAFDFTIQPLWQVYLEHFTAAAPAPDGPPAAALAAARRLVDWRAVDTDAKAGRISFGRPGMAVTLNGIAQGYITDRVAAVLRAHGLERMLVDMGETRALAAKPDGSAWRVGIADPSDPAAVVDTLEIVDKAVATSGGYGTLFDEAGRFTHLIVPTTGATAPARASATVIADSAAKADALSTALAVAPADRRRAIVTAAGVSALFVSAEGTVTRMAG